MISRIYVINLPYKPDRRDRLASHLKDIGLFPEKSIRWVRALSGDWSPGPAWWKSGNGAWGCLMSHLHVVHEAIMDGLENYLVIEDDVCFHSRTREMLGRLMREMPEDWDQIYLGGQHLKPPLPVQGSPFVLRGQNVNRTHAFMLKRKAFVRFQQHILHAPDYIAHPGWHIDHQLGTAHERRDWNVYCPAWWLAGQDEGSSNISGRNNPRMWWHPWTYSHFLPVTQIPAEQKNSLPEDIRERFHFGNNLLSGTLQDIGLTDAVDSDERLRDWLIMIAREAMDRERLPAIQHPDISLERVRRLWRPGVWPLAEAPLVDWADYPWNGLFPHPLNQPESVRAFPPATGQRVSAA